jgi:uncharacterized phage protein (TIGR02216 family)
VDVKTLALQLAGQTAILLGWRPDDFWSATPAELAAILSVYSVGGDCSADTQTLSELMELFPDAPTGGE